ncbi:MAG: HAD-IIB family hydrolase [Deltaproteobacteria bacterium]|nr:HAD-IIB family hydrolase [Deltaproteobacteria bacterium]
MQPLKAMSASVRKGIRTLFTDIDDTITTEGRVPGEAFSALWRAHEAGLAVVLVTGRPAGWCDHFARMWPVKAVVGENGALCFSLQNKQMTRIYAPRPEDAKERLARIQKEVLHEVPRARVSADQAYRAYDLAIDFAEEVDPPLDAAAIDKIVSIFVDHGAQAKVSSIHVNGWFGDHDKLSMCRRWSETVYRHPLDVDRAIYVGDSPNDEPMFEAFPHACGVANVRRFVDRMKTLPAYVAASEGGVGFAEIIDAILEVR